MERFIDRNYNVVLVTLIITAIVSIHILFSVQRWEDTKGVSDFTDQWKRCKVVKTETQEEYTVIDCGESVYTVKLQCSGKCPE